MAGVWDAVVTLDITLPSTGQLVPGSGTIYIGGPQLPTELMLSGRTGAIVFYSGPVGLAAGIKYWYISLSDAPGEQALSLGYCIGPNLREMYRGGVQPGPELFVTNQVFGGGALRLDNDNGFQLVSAASLTQPSHIRGSQAAQQDVWVEFSQVFTVAGIANTTVQYSLRRTPDFIVEVRFAVTFPSAPATLAFTTIALPGIAPNFSPDNPPVNGIPSSGSAYTNAGAIPLAARITNTGQLGILGPTTNPTGVTFITGAVMFTKAKP